MKSGLRRLANQKGQPPVPIGGAGRLLRGHAFNLGIGRQDRETMMRQYGMSGTIFSIVSLLAESTATPEWHLYRSAPVDGRRRYASGDQGSDARTEVIVHPAAKLWECPNPMHTGFEFREGSQQHEELTGETFWVLDSEIGFPTAMWYVRPDRMDPVYDDFGLLTGWIYTGPNGEQVPLKNTEVILEKRPDPLDPYRGLGPVQAIMPNIQQQRYATEYQRNLFLNGADPGGVITVPQHLNDREFDELIERWRESHRGVARAGHVGVLEDGMKWEQAAHSNKDMEYGELRQANRDELREAWRIHKSMLGTADDVNRANAQTAEEVFISWQVTTRLNRRRDTLNNKLLPLFGSTGQGVEFDYEDPSPENAEAAAAELASKATAAKTLVDAGYDPHDVLEVVGLPDMETAGIKPAPVPQVPAIAARESVTLRNAKDTQAKVFKQMAKDYPPEAIAWIHHADWSGPVPAPLDHIDWTPYDMDPPDPDKVETFVQMLRDGKKLKPVVLVKTPSNDKLTLIDGHHRYLAAAELMMPVRAWVATVDKDHGPWELTHEMQKGKKDRGRGTLAPTDLSALLRRVMSDGYVPVEVGRR